MTGATIQPRIVNVPQANLDGLREAVVQVR
jgi:hypothetical protein